MRLVELDSGHNDDQCGGLANDRRDQGEQRALTPRSNRGDAQVHTGSQATDEMCHSLLAMLGRPQIYQATEALCSVLKMRKRRGIKQQGCLASRVASFSGASRHLADCQDASGSLRTPRELELALDEGSGG